MASENSDKEALLVCNALWVAYDEDTLHDWDADNVAESIPALLCFRKHCTLTCINLMDTQLQSYMCVNMPQE